MTLPVTARSVYWEKKRKREGESRRCLGTAGRFAPGSGPVKAKEEAMYVIIIAVLIVIIFNNIPEDW